MKISNYINVPQILLSSKNNGNISLTLKSFIIYLLTFILLKQGYTATSEEILGMANELVHIIAWATGIYGAMRKILYVFKDLRKSK